MRRFTLRIPDAGRVTVTRTSDVEDFRRVYSYAIRDEDGDLLGRGRDLFSGQAWHPNLHPDPDRMTADLLTFLTDVPGDFPPRIATWAREHHDRLTMAALDMEESWSEEPGEDRR